MRSTLFPTKDCVIAQRVREIQAQWSPQERLRRAAAGRRLQREFVRRILSVPSEPEIWAVGAPADQDWQRIAV